MGISKTENIVGLIGELESAIPTGVQPMLAQFNKASGAFVNVIGRINPEYLDNDHYVYIEVEIDHEHQHIVGTVKNFEIVDSLLAPTKIYERHLNAQCKAKINKRFQPEVQLDILRKVVAELCEKLGHENEALADMNDYIDAVKNANKVLKASYINNKDFEYISIESEQAIEEAKLDGGLHEVMGPKNLIELGPYRT